MLVRQATRVTPIFYEFAVGQLNFYAYGRLAARNVYLFIRASHLKRRQKICLLLTTFNAYRQRRPIVFVDTRNIFQIMFAALMLRRRF